MTAGASLRAIVACRRFGLGPRPGELASVAADPEGWLRRQLDTVREPPALAGQPDSQEGVRQLRAFRDARKAAKAGAPMGEEPGARPLREAYVEAASARSLAMIGSDAPFVERLVAFWSNHFTVSVQRPVLAPLVGSFEREAIRPHVTGRFRDMLLAATRHPAMLLYLDNAQSIGPHSLAGTFSGRGLNENLAREVLELHTLGVDGGYTQADVTAFARILTGWSIGREGEPEDGGFRWRPRAHEPGGKILLGRRFPEAGEEEGRLALDFLAAHPATARHVARKLACHFIADDPPAAAVDRVAVRFTETEGDLRETALCLLAEPACWDALPRKVKTPQDLVVSTYRALDPGIGDGRRVFGSLAALGQMPFAAPSPAGWPDTADQWIGPDAVLKRIDWCQLAGERAAPFLDPARLQADSLGPACSGETARAVARAPTPAAAIALLLASPEFQRR